MTSPLTPQQIKQQVSESLVSLRKQADLTQAQVAKALGIKQPAYQAYEAARAIPPLNVMVDIKLLYGLKSIEELFGYPEPNKSIDNQFITAPDHIKKAIKTLLCVDY